MIKQILLNTNCFEDNEWLDKYCELIEINKDTQAEKGKTNKHHIIPKCYYKNNNLAIDNSQENLVNLFYKDHILVHYYLCLCTKDKLKHQLEYAFKRMIPNIRLKRYNLNNFEIEKLPLFQTIYESWLKYRSDIMKTNNPSKREEVRKLMSKSRKDYIITHYTKIKEKNKLMMTDEVKDKIRKSNLISHNTLESKLKSSKNQSEIWKDPSYRQKQHQTRQSLKYKDLMASKMTGKLKGYIVINNGVSMTKIPPEKLQYFKSLGWVEGMLPQSEEIKKHKSEAAIRRFKEGRGPINTHCIKVHCVTLNKTFLSIKEAAKFVSISEYKLKKSIIKKIPINGLFFEYKGGD